MSKDGDIRNEGRIITGRKGEDTSKYKANLKKIDWSKHKSKYSREETPSREAP